MMTTGTRLTDLVREAGGWPIDLELVGAVLERADRVLKGKGGRDYKGELTIDEIDKLGFVARDATAGR